MLGRETFKAFVVEALRSLGGSGSVVEVTKYIWQVHENDLRQSGDLFFTWQYDVRWAAQYLRNHGFLAPVHGDRRAPWRLSDEGWHVDLEKLPSNVKRMGNIPTRR
ncbi:hypothetical protein [Microbacterium terrisoli]|uniref:hypothetical protein n=1 Tax=Microbacterium terrisoli TaxID=3242192 RepID=UPI0028045917|nr:hypothetical protein [Microbacterium protaetiae]